MRKLLLLFSLLFSLFSFAQNEFITIWKPSNPSTQSILGGVQSTSTQIWFPGRGTNFNVYWEEIGYPTHNGTIDMMTSTNHFLLDFGTPLNPNPNDATYQVKIGKGSGSFDAIKSYDGVFISPQLGIPILQNALGDFLKIISVAQWGDIVWTTMEAAFADCLNLDITATDIPNLSNVTSTSLMFSNCNLLIANPSINNWNTASITNMSHMFSNAGDFNQPLNNWNTSNVTDMRWMFHYLSEFNQPLSNWNVSNVTTMIHMFHYCTTFNQDISSWDVSSVTDFRDFLQGCTNFNQNLGSWNLQNLKIATNMLNTTGLDCGNYDSTLYGWSNNPNTATNIDLGNLTPLVYSSTNGVNSRNFLINNKGWIFLNDSYNPNCETTLSVDNAAKSEFFIYPNPVSDFLFIRSKQKIKSISIYEVSGKLVLKKTKDFEKINVSNLVEGNYFLSIHFDAAQESMKFIKVK